MLKRFFIRIKEIPFLILSLYGGLYYTFRTVRFFQKQSKQFIRKGLKSGHLFVLFIYPEEQISENEWRYKLHKLQYNMSEEDCKTLLLELLQGREYNEEKRNFKGERLLTVPLSMDRKEEK